MRPLARSFGQRPRRARRVEDGVDVGRPAPRSRSRRPRPQALSRSPSAAQPRNDRSRRVLEVLSHGRRIVSVPLGNAQDRRQEPRRLPRAAPEPRGAARPTPRPGLQDPHARPRRAGRGPREPAAPTDEPRAYLKRTLKRMRPLSAGVHRPLEERSSAGAARQVRRRRLEVMAAPPAATAARPWRSPGRRIGAPRAPVQGRQGLEARDALGGRRDVDRGPVASARRASSDSKKSLRSAARRRLRGFQIFDATARGAIGTRLFGRPSRTRREPSMRRTISRIDSDVTELERSQVWRDPPTPVVGIHAGRRRGPKRRSARRRPRGRRPRGPPSRRT